MRFFTVPLLFVATIPCTVSAAVDPGLLDLVPSDAKVLMGVQVQQALRSSFGQFALTNVPENDAMSQFIAATGFDFRRDLLEILIASDGVPAATATGKNVVLVRGAFQPGRIAGLAAVSGAVSTSYAGIPIVTSSGGNPVSGAFLDADTLILGSADAIKGAIDLRAAGGHNAGALAQKAVSASGIYDVWVITTEPLSSFSIPKGAPAAALSSIREASAGITFSSAGASVTGEAVTSTGQDALAIAAMGQLLLAMAQSNKAPNAQSGAALLQNAQITADGPTIRLTLSIPEQQLEQMLASRPAARKVSAPAQ